MNWVFRRNWWWLWVSPELMVEAMKQEEEDLENAKRETKVTFIMKSHSLPNSFVLSKERCSGYMEMVGLGRRNNGC